MPLADPAVSVVVPTFREASNLRPLTERLFAATRAAGLEAELIVADDDSRDGSVELVGELAAEYPLRIIVRTGPRGLAPAVLEGFEHARGRYVFTRFRSRFVRLFIRFGSVFPCDDLVAAGISFTGRFFGLVGHCGFRLGRCEPDLLDAQTDYIRCEKHHDTGRYE